MSLKSSMKSVARDLVIQLMANVGSGYHPDNSASEYINMPGPDQWSEEDKRALDLANELCHHVLSEEIYETCLKYAKDRIKQCQQYERFDEVLAIIKGEAIHFNDGWIIDKIQACRFEYSREGLISDCPTDLTDLLDMFERNGVRALVDCTRQELLEGLAQEMCMSFGEEPAEEFVEFLRKPVVTN